MFDEAKLLLYLIKVHGVANFVRVSGKHHTPQKLTIVAAHDNGTTQPVQYFSSPMDESWVTNWCIKHFDPLFLGRHRRVTPPHDD